jgi:hypothetical protein
MNNNIQQPAAEHFNDKASWFYNYELEVAEGWQ